MLDAVIATLFPWPVAMLWRNVFRYLRWRYDFYLGWGSSGLCAAISYAISHLWLPAAGSGLNVAAAAICWWWSRRNRKRSAGLIGAKSRALVAAMVARMRETARPRRVLKPVPGGA